MATVPTFNLIEAVRITAEGPFPINDASETSETPMENLSGQL